MDNKFINFKLYQINNIILFYYKNQFDLNDIVNKLDISHKLYNDLEKVMDLIDDCYNNNKLLLKLNTNDKINVIIKYQLGNKDNECLLTLIKEELDINEKFELIFNKIISLKNNKEIKIDEYFKNIEKLLIDLKEDINKKLEDNVNKINELKNEIEKNKIDVENNNKIIKILKNEIFNLNHKEMKNKIYEINIENKNIGKGFFTKILYNNNLLSILIVNNIIEENKIIIKNEKEKKEMELKDRMKYINKGYKISIIEIKKKDNIKNYIEIDDNKNNENILYKGKTIYILDDMISYGKINEIEEGEFKYECYIENNSLGLPIINMKNNKIIGIKKDINNGLFLQSTINDIINISKFNKKYNLNIKDINLQKLNLKNKRIGDKGFEILEKINFKELKELYLSGNIISDIKILEKVRFEQLEILNLGSNKISDINILEKVNFKNLKKLYLHNNNISDIKILKKVRFEQLEILNLDENKISDINILEKVNFKNLKELYLDNNNISDIKILKKVRFEQLKILDLRSNKISYDKYSSLINKLKSKMIQFEI